MFHTFFLTHAHSLIQIYSADFVSDLIPDILFAGAVPGVRGVQREPHRVQDGGLRQGLQGQEVSCQAHRVNTQLGSQISLRPLRPFLFKVCMFQGQQHEHLFKHKLSISVCLVAPPPQHDNTITMRALI